MPLDWQPLVDLVHARQKFLLTTHIRPDGDALGSMLALGEALRRLGKDVRMVVASSVAPRYRFLEPYGRVEHFEPPGDEYGSADAVVVLDTGAWGQLGSFGPFLQTLPAAKVVIDHHVTQDDLGAVRLVDTTAEATGRLVREAVGALGLPLSETMATLLFVALAMDTGWFRHSNTRAPTMALGAELLAAGVRPELLYDELFEQNTLPRTKLMGLVLDRLETAYQGQVAYSEIRKADYEATGAVPSDTEDLVNLTRSLRGVEVGLFFMEQPRGGVKVSLRARSRVDVARIAGQFGGGGHRLAAGVTLTGTLEEARARVLEAIGAALAASA
jgi:phosphoesterase RecJ-like protein